MALDVHTLGLRSSYDFRETHIPTTKLKEDLREKLRTIVSPAIRDLESKGLINGFHHIVHEHIDLRLSSADWALNEEKVKQVLAAHAISTDLKRWEPMPAAQYGGPVGVILCYNNLEFNSRLALALAELMYDTADESVRKQQEKLCPHQWVHYLCNQCGCLNAEQVLFEFNDAFLWLKSLVDSGGPQGKLYAEDVLAKLKAFVAKFENDLSGQGE